MKNAPLTERVGGKADPFRTIQLHPTRRCNLSCLHCYSSSSPKHREMLAIGPLKNFLTYAYDQGFNNISLSGGEPFLYSHLEELLTHTRSIGYQNTVATNGMLLGSEQNKRLLKLLDIVAVSIDGPPDLHDHIRNQKGAFDKMMLGVEILRGHNVPFGFIHTVTPQSWQSLLWLGEHARESGAKLLQLHPLEMYGRAVEKMQPTDEQATLPYQIFILANYLRSKYGHDMVVQLDMLHRDYLQASPESVHSFLRNSSRKPQVATSLDTIVINEQGLITPVSYGFDTRFEIGSVYTFDENLFEAFAVNKLPEIRKVFDQTLGIILENERDDLVNWNELLIEQSALHPLPVAA